MISCSSDSESASAVVSSWIGCPISDGTATSSEGSKQSSDDSPGIIGRSSCFSTATTCSGCSFSEDREKVMNWICYLVDKIARFWGGNDSSFVNFQSNLNNPPLKNVGGIKVALFSIHSELLTKEDAVKVLQVVDDAVASEFVKKIIGAMARAARVGMQKPNEQQTTSSAERTDGDRSGYELPEELKGLFVVYNKLVQFIRDSHIDPIRKPNPSSLLPSVF